MFRPKGFNKGYFGASMSVEDQMRQRLDNILAYRGPLREFKGNPYGNTMRRLNQMMRQKGVNVVNYGEGLMYGRKRGKPFRRNIYKNKRYYRKNRKHLRYYHF